MALKIPKFNASDLITIGRTASTTATFCRAAIATGNLTRFELTLDTQLTSRDLRGYRIDPNVSSPFKTSGSR